MKNSVKEIENELESIGNRADQMKERISDIKCRNLKNNAEGRRERPEH